MSDIYTCTDGAQEMPELTIETLLRPREELKPILYYRASKYVPSVDIDGVPFVLSVRVRHLEFDDLPSATPDERIVYLHPDNLPEFAQTAAKNGYRLVQRD